MPIIINSNIGHGTRVRYIRPELGYSGEDMPDITIGRVYTIEGRDGDGDAFFIDDVGDKNFAASEDGMAIFEIVE